MLVVNVLVVDTSVWISYFRGDDFPDLDSGLKEARVFLPPVVVSELLSGKMPEKKRDQLSLFLKELPLCQHDFEHWAAVGTLRGKLLRHGISVSTPDAHVACCALDLDGYLLSQDGVFKKIARHSPLKLL